MESHKLWYGGFESRRRYHHAKVLPMKSFESLHTGQETVGSGTSATMRVHTGDMLGVAVAVTDINGTLDLRIEWSPDGTNFGDAESTPDAFTQLSATGTVAKSFAVKGPFYRLNWTVGTTDATFTVAAVS